MLSKGCRGFSRSFAAENPPSPWAHVFHLLTLPLALSMSFVLSLLLPSLILICSLCLAIMKLLPALMSTNKRMIKQEFFNITWIFPSLGLCVTKERSNKWRNSSSNPPSFLPWLYLLLFTALTFSFSKYICTYTYSSSPSAWNIDEFCSPKWRFVGEEACS